MYKEKIWVLLSKKMANEASSTELEELELLVKEHPEWQHAIQNVESFFRSSQPADTEEAEDAYYLLKNKMQELGISLENEFYDPLEYVEQDRLHIKRRNKKIGLSIAATVLLLISMWGFGLFSSSGKERESLAQLNEVSTRNGSTSRVQLPDGSIVMLNAGSKLSYNKNFGVDTREVYLSGEAFFDVKKMEKAPFYIHTTDIDIKVLGTAFNVKSYPEDKTTETSLLRGSIEISIKSRPKDKIVLSPNEKLVIERDGGAIVSGAPVAESSVVEKMPSNVSVYINKLKYNIRDSSIVETQWIENKFVFADKPFEEIAKMMNRWYDVVVDIQNESIKQVRFTGSFENETIEQALEALGYSMPFSFEKTGNRIIIN